MVIILFYYSLWFTHRSREYIYIHVHYNSYPQVATRNTAAKIFLTALHFASDVSAPIRTPLNQEQENWLTTSANGVIRNRKFHLPLRARQQKREDLLSYRPKSESSVLPFVLTYHPDLPKVRDIVNKHWPFIESSSTLSEIFTERLTMAYRRPKSAGSSCTCQAQIRHAWWWTTWGDMTVRQSKMQNLQNDNPYTDREVSIWGNNQA